MVKNNTIGYLNNATSAYNKHHKNNKGVTVMKNKKAFQIASTGLMAALSYVVFTFLQIKITLPGGDATSIHLGNAVCVLGALILGGVYGGLGGAIGMTIGDLFDPVYVIYAPKTLILKFCIGMITGIVAHKVAHITYSNDQKYILRWTVISGAAGLVFNAVFDPLFGYFYKLLILGKPAAELVLAYNVASSSFNAVISLIAATIVYMALLPALKKSGLFITIGKNKNREG